MKKAKALTVPVLSGAAFQAKPRDHKLSLRKAQAALAAKRAEQAIQKHCQFKKVILLDTGDSCWTDHSVKVKPHKGGAGVVMKCTDKGRLLKALAQAQVPAKVVKGRKHWVAIPVLDGGSELVVK